MVAGSMVVSIVIWRFVSRYGAAVQHVLCVFWCIKNAFDVGTTCGIDLVDPSHYFIAKVGTWTCLAKGSEIAFWEGSVTESAQS